MDFTCVRTVASETKSSSATSRTRRPCASCSSTRASRGVSRASHLRRSSSSAWCSCHSRISRARSSRGNTPSPWSTRRITSTIVCRGATLGTTLTAPLARHSPQRRSSCDPVSTTTRWPATVSGWISAAPSPAGPRLRSRSTTRGRVLSTARRRSRRATRAWASGTLIASNPLCSSETRSASARIAWSSTIDTRVGRPVTASPGARPVVTDRTPTCLRRYARDRPADHGPFEGVKVPLTRRPRDITPIALRAVENA